MSIERFIYKYGTRKARRMLKKFHSKQELKEFSDVSLEWFNKVHKELPELSNCVFVSSYRFIPSYIGWYHALLNLGYDGDEIIGVILSINKRILISLPNFLRRAFRKSMFQYFEEKGEIIQKHGIYQGKDSLDWKIEYKQYGKNDIEFKIHECLMIKVARKYDAINLFPRLCELNVQNAKYLHYQYEQPKSLGRNDEYCLCHYKLKKK